MKKTFRNLLLIATMALSFTACKKDKDQAASQFTYDGKSYELKAATSFSSGSYTDLSLYSTTTLTSGTANAVDFYFDASELKTGTYTYLSDSDPNYDATKHFSESSVNFNITLPNWDGGTYYDVTAGTVTITKDGSNYKVVFDLTAGDKKLTGSYFGAISSN